jgi:DNA-directed RNA polymerase subunit H (RpoH/RPB5)
METRFKIIETESYLIATSTKDFETNYYYNEFDKALRIGIVRQPYHKSVVGYYSKDNSIELDLPLLPEIVVEDYIEKLAWETKCLSRKEVYKLFNEDVFKEKRLDSKYSISASKQVHEFNEKLRILAKDNSKSVTKVYSEEDLRKAIELSRVTYQDKSFGKTMFKYKPGEVIQLTKESKTPEWFVAEMEQVILKDPNSCEHYIEVGCIKDICTCYTFRLKTTTINNKTYLVGHYE